MELLGISLTDAGLEEALTKTNEYLEHGGLNTIAYVSARKLLEASEDEEQQKWWGELDLTICEDVEILKAAGEDSESRMKEVEDNAYLKEFLKILIHRQETVFLLATDEKSLEEFEEELRLFQNGWQGNIQNGLRSRLRIIGRETTERYEENKEGLINSMNAVAPRVILSRLPYPEGIRLMYDYRRYLNGCLWLTLSENLVKDHRNDWTGKVSDFFYKKLFDKKIHKFEQEKE